jgi:hypothetical protein
MRQSLSLFLALSLASLGRADEALSAIEARTKLGVRITVEMKVQSSKDVMKKSGKIYPDDVRGSRGAAERDPRDPNPRKVTLFSL